MNLTQPILVAPAGGHLDVLATVAKASLACARQASSEESAWRTWRTSCGSAKVVKRASLPKTHSLADLFGAGTATGLEAFAVALPPAPPGDWPAVAVKAQAAHFEREREQGPLSVHDVPKGLVVLINADLGMSTGKAAAQAAHAVEYGVLAGMTTSAQVSDHLRVFEAPASALVALAQAHPTVKVRDQGRTEVAAGSLTAVLVIR